MRSTARTHAPRIAGTLDLLSSARTARVAGLGKLSRYRPLRRARLRDWKPPLGNWRRLLRFRASVVR